MHRNDCSRAWSYCGRDSLRVYVVGSFDWLDWNRSRSALRGCKPGSDVRVRGDNDLVPWPDAVCAQYEVQRLQAVGNADAVFDTAIGSELAFEAFDLFPKDVPARVQHSPKGSDEG